MISRWILDKLDHLKDEKRIILKDPQRMIRRGELAVDGWGKDNGFTVLLCHGNLALRDWFERIRDDGKVKMLLVDRTRGNNRKLFYPDIEAATKDKCRINLTLKEFLNEETEDSWPSLVNDRIISRIIMDNLEGVLKAYRMFRKVKSSGFMDDDLYRIILGGALGIKSFGVLSAGDIRKLCMEQHSKIEELTNLLPEEIMEKLFDTIRTAPKPFNLLNDVDPDDVFRAFFLSAIMHQHDLEYKILLTSIDHMLDEFKDISPSFLDEAMEDLMKSDPDMVLEDIRKTENYLIEHPEKLSFLLHDRLQIDKPSNALNVLRQEGISPMIREMAMVSLLLDLLENQEKAAYQNVLDYLETEDSQEKTGPAHRRPSEKWQELVRTYRRTVEIVKLLSVLKKTALTLKVAKTSSIKFEVFDKIWNQKKMNRLDYYLSELDRTLRVHSLLPVPLKVFWKELEIRWEKTREYFKQIYREAVEYKDLIDSKFQDYYRANYVSFIKSPDSPAIFTHQFLPRVFKKHWDPKSGKKAVIMIFDGLRVDAWEEFLREVFEEKYEVTHSYPGSALLPTETQLSRKAISAGELPDKFLPGNPNEKKLLEKWLKNNLHLHIDFETIADDDTRASGMTARFSSKQVELIIFNFSDKNLHGSEADLSFIYDNMIKNIIREDVRTVLKELPEDVMIFITSDHGFIEIGNEKIGIENRYTRQPSDVKPRNARIQNKFTTADSSNVIEFDVDFMGIPTRIQGDFSYDFSKIIFPRPGYFLKRAGKGGHHDRYSHGGLSLAECMIPMVVLERKDVKGKPVKVEKIEVRGAFEEGSELEIVVFVRSSVKIDEDIPLTLQVVHENVNPLREIFSGTSQEYIIKWKPVVKPDEIPDDSGGYCVKNLTVVCSYKYNGKTVRSSGVTDVRLAVDSSRIRRRMSPKLDMVIGLIPKGLR